MPRTIAIDGVVELSMWAAYFSSVAAKHYAAKEVHKSMMYLAGLLVMNEERILDLSASGYPKLDRFTRTGGMFFLTRKHDGYQFCFRFNHEKKKILLTNLNKEVLYEFDNRTNVDNMGTVINDLLAGKLN